VVSALAVLLIIADANAAAIAKAQTMFALSLPWRRKHTSLVRSIMTISLPFGPAGLPQVSALYYVPSRMLNAFAVGQSKEVAIVPQHRTGT
jgi:Zn-dependent protease with chaperone function